MQTPSCLRNLAKSLPDRQVKIPKVLVGNMCCWLHIACVRALMKIKHWEINKKNSNLLITLLTQHNFNKGPQFFLINDGRALLLHNAQGIKLFGLFQIFDFWN